MSGFVIANRLQSPVMSGCIPGNQRITMKLTITKENATLFTDTNRDPVLSGYFTRHFAPAQFLKSATCTLRFQDRSQAVLASALNQIPHQSYTFIFDKDLSATIKHAIKFNIFNSGGAYD